MFRILKFDGKFILFVRIILSYRCFGTRISSLLALYRLVVNSILKLSHNILKYMIVTWFNIFIKLIIVISKK